MQFLPLAMIIAGSEPQTTIQSAINQAAQNPRAVVYIPPTYLGTDGYSNPSSVPIFDMRGAGSISFGGGSGTASRLILTGATALTGIYFTLSAGWGSGASVSTIHGSDGAHYFTVTAGSSGFSIAPTITMSFADGAWTFAPIIDIDMMGGTGSFADVGVSSTTTSYTATFYDTPAPGATYIFRAILVGPVS